jgi:hypothetical protein
MLKPAPTIKVTNDKPYPTFFFFVAGKYRSRTRIKQAMRAITISGSTTRISWLVMMLEL